VTVTKGQSRNLEPSMIEYLTSEEAAALIMQNDPHFHSKQRGCELQKKDDTKKCKTHKIDICNPSANDCGWELSDQGDWHYGRFFPRLKQYRVLTYEEVYTIRYSGLSLSELASSFHISQEQLRKVQKNTYTPSDTPNEAITP